MPDLPPPQLDLIRRYSRMLREQQAVARGPRVGARERRRRREAVQTVLHATRGQGEQPRPAP